jgi:hypothetical protein
MCVEAEQESSHCDKLCCGPACSDSTARRDTDGQVGQSGMCAQAEQESPALK